MKRFLILLFIIFIVGCKDVVKEDDKMNIEGVNIELLGHSTVKISNNVVIYFDPFVLPSNPEKADLILISHEHYDHCDARKVSEIIKEDTIIVTVPDCQSKLNSMNVKEIKEEAFSIQLA